MRYRLTGGVLGAKLFNYFLLWLVLVLAGSNDVVPFGIPRQIKVDNAQCICQQVNNVPKQLNATGRRLFQKMANHQQKTKCVADRAVDWRMILQCF
jgi:hypothetical protein